MWSNKFWFLVLNNVIESSISTNALLAKLQTNQNLKIHKIDFSFHFCWKLLQKANFVLNMV